MTPLVVPWIVASLGGWRAAFFVTGAMGFFWILVWLVWYRQPNQHPQVNAAELAHINQDEPDPPVKVGWLQLLHYRATWAFIVGMGISSPIWWFYLNWIPGYLQQTHGLDLKSVGPPVIAIYLFADVGSIGGGWLSSHLIKRGWSVTAARKTALLVCALLVLPVFLTARTDNLLVATCLIALAASAHQGFSANLYTLVSDTMPRYAISSVVGMGGFVGSMIGGLLLAPLIGWILDHTNKNYTIPFAIASLGYVVAWIAIHLILPRFEPVQFVPSEQRR
jgi:ACS family hexuronate transporter-like MFS transporter